MAKGLGILETHEWVGTFAHPGATGTVAGRLKYAPEIGLTLLYFSNFGTYEGAGSMLHGVLENGQACTLYGNFNMESAGFSFNLGTSIHRGTWRPSACIFGFHFEQDHKFSGLEISLSNLQEFFAPKGADFPWLTQPIVEAHGNNLDVKIFQSATFGLLGHEDQLRSILHTVDPALKEALIRAISAVLQSGDKPQFAYFRKDLNFVVELTRAGEISLDGAVMAIATVRRLFSLLFFRSTIPLEINLIDRDEEGRKYEFPVLRWFGGLNSRTIERYRKPVEYHFLPFNHSSIDLKVALEKWLSVGVPYELFASKFVSDSGTKDVHGLQGEFVIQLAQIEAIGQELRLPHKDRYRAVIIKCAGDAYVRRLGTLLGGDETSDVGKLMSDVRAEIAHFSGKQSRLEKANLFYACHLLDAVIASHIFTRLELPREGIQTFLKKELEAVRSGT